MEYKNLDQVRNGIIDYIKDLFNKIPDEEKANLAYFIAYQATVFGSYNIFEGIGVLEAAKRDYISISEQVLSEEEGD